jgi:hypothetical protein
MMDGQTDMEKLMDAFLQLFFASEQELDLRKVDWIQLDSFELFVVCFVYLMTVIY